MSFHRCLNERPHYNNTIARIVVAFAGVFMWSSYILVISQLLEGTRFSGGI